VTAVEFVGTQGEFEVWRQGDRTFVGVAIRDEMPAAIKSGLARRRSTWFTGRCDCGAVIEVMGDPAGPLTRTECAVSHRRDCPADDDWLEAAFDAWRAGLSLPDLDRA
jgi:hypothetical protein